MDAGPLEVIPLETEPLEAARPTRSLGLKVSTEDHFEDPLFRVIAQEPPAGVAIEEPGSMVVGVRMGTVLTIEGVEAYTCADAEHSWMGPSLDGVPAEGDATRTQAEALLRSGVRQRHGAVHALVYERDGVRWRRLSDGDVGAVAGRLASVALLLPSPDTCPSAPQFEQGVPLTFLTARR